MITPQNQCPIDWIRTSTVVLLVLLHLLFFYSCCLCCCPTSAVWCSHTSTILLFFYPCWLLRLLFSHLPPVRFAVLLLLLDTFTVLLLTTFVVLLPLLWVLFSYSCGDFAVPLFASTILLLFLLFSCSCCLCYSCCDFVVLLLTSTILPLLLPLLFSVLFYSFGLCHSPISAALSSYLYYFPTLAASAILSCSLYFSSTFCCSALLPLLFSFYSCYIFYSTSVILRGKWTSTYHSAVILFLLHHPLTGTIIGIIIREVSGYKYCHKLRICQL